MIKGIPLVVTPFMQNARVVYCAKSKEAVVVDPGGDSHIIVSCLNENDLICKAVWLTHSHLDHCGGVADLISALNVPLVGHPAEEYMRAHVDEIAGLYGIPSGYFKNCPEPGIYVQGGEKLELGENSFEVLFTPGHSPGHVSFYCKEHKVVISGDCLFSGSIGRTDLPGGNHEQLIDTIHEQLLALPDETEVWCGHGPDTTIGEERRSNPFLQ
ncbi:MAG: MBL fold metallo-hydrolase [Deltaproteobacteria bacterium]|nr:MBL fold metallo-hydrolase [Deltaproteobacteria bacterium]